MEWRKNMTQYTPMIQQYLKIKADYMDSFLFFRLGDFYEMFFEDAVLASKVLEITLTGRVGGTEDKIPMCGIPYHSSDQYIKKLIEKGYKVAICEQVEDPKQAQGVVKREVIRVITPGTIMEQSMLQEGENNYILFLTREQQHFSMAACDLSTGELVGTETNSLLLLIEEVSQFKAPEIVIDEDAFEESEIEYVKSVFPYQSSLRKRDSLFNEKWIGNVSLLEGDEQLTIGVRTVLTFMLQYLDETQKRSIDHIKKFHFYQPTTFLKLDSYSKRNLELTETIRDHSKKGSLLWLLDETSTAMGGRLIKKWIQRPLLDVNHIQRRLEAVSNFMKESFEREELVQSLDEVYDLERLAVRVSYGNVNPRDLVQVKKSLQAIPTIFQQLAQMSPSYIHEQIEKLDSCQELALLLEKAVVEEPPLSIKEGGIFRSGYNTELDRLQEASREGKRWIAELEASERKNTGIKSLKVGFNKVFGYYIEVTRANSHLLEDKRYERKQTLANAERYITPELKEKEALILEANDRLMDVEYQLFLELRDEVNKHTQSIQKLAEFIAELDILCSFARVSEKYRYVQPIFSQDGSLSIKQGRHPVVEKVLKQTSFVANDLYMDKTGREILLITGPNMAGKSTYMRQVALIAIMAQIGCFVPVAEATLPVFDQIFTRIGAADDLVGGQSTFMVEMMETKQAITHATSNSLILLDEIGRGTSTYDGMSLAQAVVEYIHDHVHAKTLFSTHYHELTVLENQLEKLTNVHVACSENNGKVIFLHTVKEGKSDRSYGIHVAQLADMPSLVIERAKEILTALEGTENRFRNEQILNKSTVAEQLNQGALIQEELLQSELVQLSFFGTNSKKKRGKTDNGQAAETTIPFLNDHTFSCLKEIEDLNLVTMTPLEALNKLFQLQQQIKK
jgi:DNA mismatch repair protein MutS